MAGYQVTAASVIDRIGKLYGRMTPEIRSRLIGDLNRWIDRMCRRWHFWFLDIQPGQYAETLFPISNVDSDITYPVTNCRFFDQGWLAARSGQFSYLFANPTVTVVDITDTVSPIQQGELWTYPEIKRVNSCQRYTEDGVFDGELPIIPPQEFRRYRDLSRNAGPSLCSWTNRGGFSTIEFNTKPDETILFALEVSLATLPPLDRPEATNAMLLYYPDTVITAGIVEAAKYFNETRELQVYQSMLYGPEYLQTSNPNAMPGGLVGEMIAATRNQHAATQHPEMQVWDSAAAALGQIGQRSRYDYGDPYSNYDQS